MNDQKQQLVERINQATNVLVAVSKNPSVDQLTAAIGLTLMLNAVDKHATTVFSGQIPSTVEFLKPEQTIEKNTDSLRDFIIALDKSKADKLRYKVEDRVVKIFITPYRTSIGEKDLEFSEGDFNVDVVICLGIHDQADLDQAITAHGRILHDAAVVSINNTAGNSLGNINWQEVSASSLSELVAGLAGAFGKDILDKQMATALLTGIVAETDRFRNAKTSPDTMNISAKLMTAGADQQLISSKLEPPAPPKPAEQPKNRGQDASGGNSLPPLKPKTNDGTLEIDHTAEHGDTPPEKKPIPESETPESKYQQIHIDEHGQLVSADEKNDLSSLLDAKDHKLSMPDMPPPASATTGEADTRNSRSHQMITHAPDFDGFLTANTEPEDDEDDDIANFLAEPEKSASKNKQFDPDTGLGIGPKAPKIDLPGPAASDEPEAPQPSAPSGDSDRYLKSESEPSYSNETLDELEHDVHSPHVEQEGGLDTARDAVEDAINALPSADDNQKAIDALNAQPLGDELHDQAPDLSSDTAPLPDSPADRPLDMPLPPSPGSQPQTSQQPEANDDTSGMPPPPPVPPPFMPGQS